MTPFKIGRNILFKEDINMNRFFSKDELIDILLNEVLSYLNENADEKYKVFSEKIAKSPYELLGVRIPIIRKLAKQCLKKCNSNNMIIELFNKLENFIVINNSKTYFEVVMLYGIILGDADIDDDVKFSYLNKYVLHILDWSVCDSVCVSFKVKSNRKLFEFLKNISQIHSEFVLRFIVVMCLNHYMKEEYIEEVVALILDINVEYYYTNMAIAWWLSELYVYNKERYFNILLNEGFNKFILKTSIQKIKDSYRVLKYDKEELVKMYR